MLSRNYPRPGIPYITVNLPSFFTSSRGGRKLIFEGFTYNKDKHDSKSGKTDWKCDIQQCKGRRITDYDDRFLKELTHSHGRDTPKIELQVYS